MKDQIKATIQALEKYKRELESLAKFVSSFKIVCPGCKAEIKLT